MFSRLLEGDCFVLSRVIQDYLMHQSHFACDLWTEDGHDSLVQPLHLILSVLDCLRAESLLRTLKCDFVAPFNRTAPKVVKELFVADCLQNSLRKVKLFVHIKLIENCEDFFKAAFLVDHLVDTPPDAFLKYGLVRHDPDQYWLEPETKTGLATCDFTLKLSDVATKTKRLESLEHGIDNLAFVIRVEVAGHLGVNNLKQLVARGRLKGVLDFLFVVSRDVLSERTQDF